MLDVDAVRNQDSRKSSALLKCQRRESFDRSLNLRRQLCLRVPQDRVSSSGCRCATVAHCRPQGVTDHVTAIGRIVEALVAVTCHGHDFLNQELSLLLRQAGTLDRQARRDGKLVCRCGGDDPRVHLSPRAALDGAIVDPGHGAHRG
jgi:hypothetical protein